MSSERFQPPAMVQAIRDIKLHRKALEEAQKLLQETCTHVNEDGLKVFTEIVCAPGSTYVGCLYCGKSKDLY